MPIGRCRRMSSAYSRTTHGATDFMGLKGLSDTGKKKLAHQQWLAVQAKHRTPAPDCIRWRIQARAWRGRTGRSLGRSGAISMRSRCNVGSANSTAPSERDLRCANRRSAPVSVVRGSIVRAYTHGRSSHNSRTWRTSARSRARMPRARASSGRGRSQAWLSNCTRNVPGTGTDKSARERSGVEQPGQILRGNDGMRHRRENAGNISCAHSTRQRIARRPQPAPHDRLGALRISALDLFGGGVHTRQPG